MLDGTAAGDTRRVALRLLGGLTASTLALPPVAARADEELSTRLDADDLLETNQEPVGAEPLLWAGPLELQLFKLVNSARASRGIPALAWDPALAEVAWQHAHDMMRRGVVSHRGGDGSTPVQRLRRAGIRFQSGSENIWTFWGRPVEAGPSTMHAAMMAEPWVLGLWNHIGNILYRGYRRIGIGIAIAPNGVQYLSEKFAD